MTIEIADRLIKYRKKAGLSQEQLAEKLGLSRQAISKWERAEASPDTDNLIELAKLYNVSLDDLINSDPKSENENDSKHDEVHIGADGIRVKDKDGDTVVIDNCGISVNGKKGTVNIGSHCGDTVSEIIQGSFVFAVVAFYILFSSLYDKPMGTTHISAWAALWPLFIFTPLPGSICFAIKRKRFCEFCYPALVAGIYCLIGMLFNMWHPWWALFITIPIYYTIFTPIDRLNHKNFEYKNSDVKINADIDLTKKD